MFFPHFLKNMCVFIKPSSLHVFTIPYGFFLMFFSHITVKLGNRDQTVKIDFKSGAEDIPLGEVSATSHTGSAVFFITTKANGVQAKTERV